MPMTDDDFMTMGAPPAQPQADASAPKVMSDDEFMSAAAPKPAANSDQASNLADIKGGLGTGLIKGGSNLATGIAANTNPVTGAIYDAGMAAKYGLPYVKRLADDVARETMNAGRSAFGKEPISQEDWDQHNKDFEAQHPILSAIDPANLASKIPSAGDAISKLAEIAGHPLYQPKTEMGQAAEQLPEYAGIAGPKALEAVPAVAGMLGGQSAAKHLGGDQTVQDLAGLAGGVGGGIAGQKAAASDFGSPESLAAKHQDAVTPDITPPKVGSDILRARAKPYYQFADDQGVNFTPEVQQGVVKDINSAFSETGRMNRSLHPNTMSIMDDMTQDAEDGNLDMEALHQYRQLFNDAINNNKYENGTLKPDGMKSAQAIGQIDQTLEDAKNNPDEMLSKGSPDAIKAWQTAQQLWASSARANDIERIMDKSTWRQNPATSMREGFASLAGNPKRFDKFTPEQQDLIQDAAKTSLSQEALRAIGSRLSSHVAGGVGATIGGWPGFIAGELASVPVGMAARAASAAIGRGRGQKITDNVAQNAPGEFQAPAAKAAPLQIGNQINMPPPETPAPAAAQTAPEAPRGPLALPSPKDMTYEDMARTGRILQSPDKTPINMTNGAPATTYNPLDLNRGDESQFAGAKNAGLDLSKLKASDAQKAVDLQSQRENDIAELSAIAKGAGINSIVKDKDFSKGATDDNDQGQTDARPQAVNQSNAVGERQQVAAGSSRSRQEGSQVGEGVSGSPSNNQALTKAQQIDAAAVHANTEPTEAQKDAGNYQKGHVNIQGLNVSIENPAGTSRSGTGPEGPWENEMPAHYGYIRKTMGADGDHLDTFIGDNPESKKVFVVDQKDPATGLFDEHKALIGFDDQKSALDAYKNSFSDGSGSRRVGAVNPMSMDNFKSWAKGDTTDKPTSYQEPKDMVNANLSAATSNIPGISRLLEQANGGDKAAHGLLNNIAYDSIDRLTSGIPSAKVIVDRNSGLYGGSVEPSLGVRMEFNASDRPAALAALAKFAQNFKQEQIHLRQPDDAEVGTRYDDGSYVTPVRSIELKSPMTQKQVQNIVDKSGLYGLTVNDKYLEAYYVGDPKDANAIDQFTKGFEKAAELAGSKNGGVGRTSQRLWVYGEGQDAIPYSKIAGDLPKPQKTSTDIPKQVAEATAGKTVTPAEQAKTITPEQKATQQQIARDYEKLPDNDLKNPLVQKAYSDLNREVVKQYNALPIKVDAWADKQGNKWTPRGGEPYKSSQEMRDDILNNYHLYVFTTSKGQFGPEGVDMTGHPLLENTGIKSDNGYPMLANDVLRAVHDYYGHLLSPTEFGPKGEEAAWKNHVATINSPMARWALTSETRGQNSWVNFGDHVDPKSSLKDRPFARQKAALLPIEHSMTGDPNLDAPMQKLARSLTAEQRKGSLGKKETGE